MRYYILLFIAFLFPVSMWGQFNPTNPDDPSMESLYAGFNYDVYKNGVAFTNESRGASRFEWNFGDGTISTEKHPEHIYTSPGKYDVVLTAINGLKQMATSYHIYIASESEYTMYGDFTLDSSKKGIRNFQSLDALFNDLVELPIDGNITITVADDLELRLSDWKILDVAERLVPKLKDSPYQINLKREGTRMSYLHLGDEFNKETYGALSELAKCINCDLYAYLGEYRFNLSERDWLFETRSICYGEQSSELGFRWYSDVFTYEWKVAEAPEGLTGYEESGTGDIPRMSVVNTSGIYQPLIYDVTFLYQGEVYDMDRVTFWVYPQTMYLNLLEPSDNGIIAKPEEVNLSWEPIPRNRNSYTVFMRRQGESDFDSKGWADDGQCHINNYNNFFQYDQTYEWYVKTNDPCNGGEIRSETRTFTIGSAADLVITDIKVEPETVVSGKDFLITVTVTNEGTKDIESKTWTDRVVCKNDYTVSQSWNQTNKSLAQGDNYKVSFQLTAPYIEDLEQLAFELEVGSSSDLLEVSKQNNKQEFEVPLALVCIPEEEFSVLCELYTQTDGEHWEMSQPWNITTNTIGKEDWEGIRFDTDGHVLEVNLSKRNLVGPLPSGLFSLPHLQVLDLSENALTGKLEEIIPESPTAPELITVNLEQNLLSGIVPASINQLPKLETLILGGNQLEAVESVLSSNKKLVVTGQKLPGLQIPLRHKFELDLPEICLYNHEEQTKEKWPTFSLKVPGYATPMELKYQEEAYGFVWNNYYHVINLPSKQDLVLTQTSNSAKNSEATIQLLFDQGDANMDGTVNLDDIRHTLNFIQEDNNSGGEDGYINFNYYSANTYQEEQEESIINVQDLVATVNILLETPQTGGGSTLRSMGVESLGPAAFLSIQGGKLVVDNPAEMIMDLDITLKGVTSKQIELLLPANNYLYRTRDVEGGVRFVLVCMNGSGIPLGKTDIMKVKGSGSSLIYAHLTNRIAKEVRSDFDGKLTATGNEVVSISDGLSAGNIRIDNDVKTLVVSVYDMSGHILSYHRLREMAPGDYKVTRWLPQELSTGIYLVHIELHKANEIKQQTIKVSHTK